MPELNIKSALICPFENLEYSPDDLKKQISQKQQLLKDLKIPCFANVLINNINSADFLITLLACLNEKIVVFPTDVKKASNYFDQLIEDYSIHYVYNGQFQRTNNSEQQPLSTEHRIVLFSSGTTGLPKGIPLQIQNIHNRILAFQKKYSHHAQQALNFLPTSFGHGLIANTLFPLATSHQLILCKKFDITVALQLAQLIDQHKINYFSSVPSVWNLLDKAKAPSPQNSSLQEVHCASAFLHQRTFSFARNWIGKKTELIINYGLTECGSWVSGSENLNSDNPYTPGYVGSALNCEIKIDASHSDGTGEVLIHSPSIPENYIYPKNQLTPIKDNNYLKTGDIGYSKNGQIYLVGRKSEFINVGGYKVSPIIIENVALKFEGVEAVAAISKPHPILDEQIALILEVTNPKSFKFEEFKIFLSKELPNQMVPKIIELIDEMPIGSNGKINKSALRS